MNLIKYLKSIYHKITKDDVLNDIDSAKNTIEVTIIPLIKRAMDRSTADIIYSAQDNAYLINIFYQTFKGSNKNFFPDLLGVYTHILVNLESIEEIVSENIENVILKDGLTAKKIILLRAVDHINFAVDYTLKLIDMMLRTVTSSNLETDKVFDLRREYVLANINVFISIIKTYSADKETFKDSLLASPDVYVDPDKDDSALLGIYNESQVDPFTEQFATNFKIPNPFYSFGKYRAQILVKKYELWKTTKKVLEMRLLKLKEKKNGGEENPVLDKEIEILEERISDLEAKIAEFEKSVE